MDHYETLGVASDATQTEIKAAYRRACSAAHPDREGGSTEQQQAVNRAYEVLSDDARRATYDSTGRDDTGPSIETEARGMLVELFRMAMDGDADWLASVRTMLANQRSHLDQSQVQAHARRARLQRHSGKIKAKVGDNLVQQLVDNQLQQIDQQLQAMERGVLVNTAVQSMLDNYESEPDTVDSGTFPLFAFSQQPGVNPPTNAYQGSSSSNNWGGMWSSVFGGR